MRDDPVRAEVERLREYVDQLASDLSKAVEENERLRAQQARFFAQMAAARYGQTTREGATA